MRPWQDYGVINGGGVIDPSGYLPFIVKGTCYEVEIRKEVIFNTFCFKDDGVFLMDPG